MQERVRILEHQVMELMHVNSRWDVDYREQEETFRRYRTDSQLAQRENQETIAHLKEENELLKEQLMRVQHHCDKEETPKRLRPTYLPVKDHNVDGQGSIQEEEIQMELTLLKHQLKAYKEDFEIERREKEMLSDERQKFQAEIMSLQLQLDRCRRELAHYSAEATRLAQQLNLRTQMDQENYRTYLQSKGYVARSSEASLPPLDPFVETDHFRVSFPDLPSTAQHLNYHHTSTGRGTQPALLAETKCPRCARTFFERMELEDHKMKCLQY